MRATAQGPKPDFGLRRILVADDSRTQRAILRASLLRWGYDVTEAETGTEALTLCARHRFDMVLSDWMMPGLSGLDLCREFRAMPRDDYGYFILLTSKSEKNDIAQGLDVGADDFLAKPVSAAELRARIEAGERILRMQRELAEKNRLLGATLGELQTLYDSLDRDLVEARKIQQSLVRDRERDFGSAKVSLMLRPSGHVGGDLVGYVPLSLRKLGLFAIDVSGHGVASAMLAARLAGMLSGIAGHADASIVGSTGPLDPWPPEIVARNLNRALIDVVRVEQYITCIYALADLATGRVELVQAGHPHPLVLRADGRVQMVGRGGLPVGLVDRASWDRTVVDLAPGDRLFLMSDGLTECPGPDGLELGEDGVAEIVRRQTELRGTRFLDALHWEVERFAAGRDAADDMSAVLYEFGI